MSTSPEQIEKALGIDTAVMAARLSALGLGAEQFALLRALTPFVEANAPAFVDDLYQRFAAQPELAALLGNEARVVSLKRQQRDYLVSLFGGPRDEAYVSSRIAIGIAHHRVRLTPQWFVATLAHLIAGQLPVIFATAPDAATGVRWSMLLVRAVLFDATLALDAYGMSELMEVRSKAMPSIGSGAPHPSGYAGLASIDERTRSLTRTQLTSAEVDSRATYVGIGQAQREAIASMRETIRGALPSVLEDFYTLFSSRPETSALVPSEAIERLKAQVHSYWEEFALATFDRPYAASRTRVGIVHERIGLSAQWYLVGLAQQCEGLIVAAATGRDDALVLVDAFVRGVVFDVTYVLDAYMDARVQTLLRTEGYANQLVQGLSAGVLIVDGLQRVLSVNRSLIDLLGIDASLLYGVSASQAVHAPQITALLDRVQSDVEPTVRAETVLRYGTRVLRVTALRLDPWGDVRGRPIALLFDDVSDLVRLSLDSESTDARLAALVHSLDATVWELDIETWTLELVSASVLALTGYRDVYFVGRRHAWTDCIHAADRERFQAYCETLPAGARGMLEHRFVHANGETHWARTVLRKVSRDTGPSLLFGVTMDISQERLAEQRGRERDIAEANSRAKTDLLATMSHDIRTPLNGVIGMLDYLLGSRLESDTAMHLRSAHQSALDLLVLLNDLLDVAKLEAGRMELHPDRFDLVALAESLCDLFGAQARAKHVLLALEFGPGLSSGWIGDVTRIRQILANLLGNAVKFTSEGTVTLRLAASSSGLSIDVLDTGVGVPEDKRATLFEPFTQAHVSRGGTGLGLAICRRLAELMLGSVRYEARAEGGSRFLFELPLDPAPPALLPAGEGRTVVGILRAEHLGRLRPRLESAGWRVETEPVPNATAYFVDDVALLHELPDDATVVLCDALRPPLPDSRRTGTTHVLGVSPLNERALVDLLQGWVRAVADVSLFHGSVLVAEDNEVSQRVVTLMLERLGFDVDVVMNGKLAVDAAQRKAYALVIMDMLMPELDGVEASRRIRASGLNRATPIVALTANALPEAHESALSAGMNDVLLKPVQMKVLRHALSRYMVQG